MKMAKRIFLFGIVNIFIVVTLSALLSLLGIRPYLEGQGINFTSLILFCLVWGFGGAFLSLALSRKMAKWMMGVQVIDESNVDPRLRSLVSRVHRLADAAGLKSKPEVGVYESPELNAFATGPSQSRSLVAVSTGLLAQMDSKEVEGVLAHEVAHIANGDMVTMTLVQGVVNSLILFFARALGFFASQFVEEEKRPIVQFGIVITAEIVLGILGMLVVATFSRAREYRADAGGASLAGTGAMVAALRALKRNDELGPIEGKAVALDTLKISGKTKGWLSLFSTHPPLDLRIERLNRLTQSTL